MSAVKIPEPTKPLVEPPAPLDRPAYPGGRSARTWRWTAGTGIALVVLATAHMIAQHFVVSGHGALRTYQQVLDYVADPVMLVVECGFLLAVTIHAMLGLRGVLLDLHPSERVRRRVDAGLWTAGTLTVVYGMALLITLAVRA
jgi:succinate dehydrogenase hydrophobic anchor subunit